MILTQMANIIPMNLKERRFKNSIGYIFMTITTIQPICRIKNFLKHT